MPSGIIIDNNELYCRKIDEKICVGKTEFTKDSE
jgi:hypothetical protein